MIRRRPKRTNIRICGPVLALHGVTSMTKAGQTCLTTCKIPMNERNLLFWSPATACVQGSRFRECAREWLRPRPLLNSSTSRSRDTRGLYGIKGEVPGVTWHHRSSIIFFYRQRSHIVRRWSKIEFLASFEFLYIFGHV